MVCGVLVKRRELQVHLILLRHAGHDGHPFNKTVKSNILSLPHSVLNGDCVATHWRTGQAVSIVLMRERN